MQTTDSIKASDRFSDAWLEVPQGRYVLDWEKRRIDSMVSDIFGYHALQIGFSNVDLLDASRIPLRQRIGLENGAQVRCDPQYLPFAAQSIDLVLLPHVLEFADDPHQILREVERILIPEGQLLVAGFNPVSLWGVSRRLARLGGLEKSRSFPWSGNYLSLFRLKDWLALLGFVVEYGAFGCFAPPCQQDAWLRRFAFMELAGDRWWAFAGAVYMLRARKRVPGLNLLRPAWRGQKVKNQALAPISRRERDSH